MKTSQSASGLLQNISLVKASNLLKSHKISAYELVNHCYNLAKIGEEDLKLNAYVHLESHEDLLEQAQASDERIRSGKPLSPLDGIPVSIKANIACKGRPLHACSQILGGEQELVSPYDSDVTEKLVRKSGAILIGQTNMDEFGMGSFGFHSSYGPTRNPLYLKDKDSFVSCGGSSSGAAATVSHGSCLAAIGTDTGGSVRLPATWCNVMGLKPTYGLISRHGIISYANSLDTVGIISRTAACIAAVLKCIAGRSERDATSIESLSMRTGGNFFKDSQSTKPLSGLRIGLPSAFSILECPTFIRDSWQKTANQFQSMGAEIIIINEDIISPETVKNSLSAYCVLAFAEASSNLMRYDGLRYGNRALVKENRGHGCDLSPLEQQYMDSRSSHLGAEVKRRIICGTAVLSSEYVHTYYESAAKLRTQIVEEFEEALSKHCEFLLVPTAISVPPGLSNYDSIEMLGNDIMTVPINLAGLPGFSFPTPNGSSFQLIGAKESDNMLLKTATYLTDIS